MKSKIRDILIFNLKFIFAIALIVYLVNSGYFSPDRLKVLLTPRAVLFGTTLVGLVLLMASVRFKTIALSNISIWQSFKLTVIGIFFNFFVPGGVGGDVVKGVVMKKNTQVSGGAAAFAVIMDRVLGLATMSALSILAFLFVPEHLRASPKVQILALFLLAIFSLITTFLAILVSSRVRRVLLLSISRVLPGVLRDKIEVFHAKQKQYAYSWSLLIQASFWSLLSQIFSIYFFYLLGQILIPELTIPFSIYVFVVPVGFMLTAVPISPGGIGVGQAAFLFLFQKALNLDTDLGSISISGFQFYQLLWGLLGAYFFIFTTKKVTKS